MLSKTQFTIFYENKHVSESIFIQIIFFYRVLCETVKDFATQLLEASISTGDQHLSDKCEILQHKLDLLLDTLHAEEQYISENTEDLTVKTDVSLPSNDKEKGVLEKPEKDITNLKRVKKRRAFMEREAVMCR